MNPIVEFVVASLILLGAAFALLGSVGLARLPDFFTRLHGPTKATTLGVGAMVLASAVYFSYPERGEPARDRGDAVPVHHRAGVRAPAVQGGAAPGQGWK